MEPNDYPETIKRWLHGPDRELRTGHHEGETLLSLWRHIERGPAQCIASAEGDSRQSALWRLEQDAVRDGRILDDIERERARRVLADVPLACPQCGNRVLDCWHYLPMVRTLVQDGDDLLASSPGAGGEHVDRRSGRRAVVYLGCSECQFGHDGQERWSLTDAQAKLLLCDEDKAVAEVQSRIAEEPLTGEVKRERLFVYLGDERRDAWTAAEYLDARGERRFADLLALAVDESARLTYSESDEDHVRRIR